MRIFKKEEFLLEQSKCPEIAKYKDNNTHGLTMQTKVIDGILCDTLHGLNRPIVPVSLRKKVFDQVHNLGHVGGKRTVDLIRTRYMCPKMNKEIRLWAQTCVNCQRCKITRYNKPNMDPISPPTAKFEEIA